MRKILLAILICLPFVAFAGEDFCRGYQVGYREGYKFVEGPYSIAPIPPLPEIGRDRFLDGYNRGFVDGVREAGGGRR